MKLKRGVNFCESQSTNKHTNSIIQQNAYSAVNTTVVNKKDKIAVCTSISWTSALNKIFQKNHGQWWINFQRTPQKFIRFEGPH